MTDDLKTRMKSKTCDGGYYAEWWQEALDRIEQLEAALRYVDSKIYINDYGDCALNSDFDYNLLCAALGEKKD